MQKSFLRPVRLLQVLSQIVAHTFQLTDTFLKKRKILLYQVIQMHAICFKTGTDNFVNRLVHRFAMLSPHLAYKVENFLDLPLFVLAFMFSIVLSLLHGLFNLIIKVVNIVVLDHLVQIAHLLEPILLFFSVNALFLIAYLLTLERMVVLLLRICHDSRLKWCPLSHDFRCTSLNELACLANVYQALRLSSFTGCP